MLATLVEVLSQIWNTSIQHSTSRQIILQECCTMTAKSKPDYSETTFKTFSVVSCCREFSIFKKRKIESIGRAPSRSRRNLSETTKLSEPLTLSLILLMLYQRSITTEASSLLVVMIVTDPVALLNLALLP